MTLQKVSGILEAYREMNNSIHDLDDERNEISKRIKFLAKSQDSLMEMISKLNIPEELKYEVKKVVKMHYDLKRASEIKRGDISKNIYI